jgi:hypothetical protein
MLNCVIVIIVTIIFIFFLNIVLLTYYYSLISCIAWLPSAPREVMAQ